MAAKLLPSHLLDNFFKRPDATGQRDEGIGELEHLLFALMHIVRDDNLATRSRALTVHQKCRDNAGDLATMVEYGISNFTHQPDRTAAVDQPDAHFGHGFSKRSGGVDEGGV